MIHNQLLTMNADCQSMKSKSVPPPDSLLAASNGRGESNPWRIPIFLLCTLGLMAFSENSKAEVSLPPVLSSHMVLQRDVPVPIWGTAAPGEKVTVKFRDQQKTANADAQGKWMIKLDALKVGEAATLTVMGVNTVTLNDVLVGEVWLGSGQSNMDTHVFDYIRDASPPSTLAALDQGQAGDGAKDAATKYHIRDEVLERLAQQTYPQLRLISSANRQGWKEATPENIIQFSALLFSYGQFLQKELGVPVGLIAGAVGATSSEQWVSREAYQSDDACKKALDKFSTSYSIEAEQKKYEAALAKWEKETAASSLTSEAPQKKTPTKPRPPFHPGEVTRDLTLPNKNIGDLYEIHIRPLIPYAIRGVFWDQGEGGTGIFGLDQYSLIGALIGSWRKDWSQGEFPFLYVQKPSGRGCAFDYEDPVTKQAEAFAAMLPGTVPTTLNGIERETYIRISRYPSTAMVTSSDLGTGTHPINKSGYGARACRVALATVYGRKIEYYGPVYESFEVAGNKMRIRFTHLGKGLVFAHGDKLQGFAIAGEDKKFCWADAVIDGKTVVVSSAAVTKPVAVRYAWSGNHPWANLFNQDGLPAQAFRTDDWTDDR